MELREPILPPRVPTKSYLTPEMSPLHRYNMFISCYNQPCNMIDGIQLARMPDSNLYSSLFQLSSSLRGKLCFIFICSLPLINLLPLFQAGFFAFIYWKCVGIHSTNCMAVKDPCKKMTFDPQMCFSLGCDYYFFNITLNQLEGFRLNYQGNLNERLNLRLERGRTQIMIYNANFWGSYHYFHKWKTFHYAPLAISVVLALISNIALILVLVK